MAQTFDCVVIGGGIMGCSTAFQLAQRGMNVALLDKKNIGEGPTEHDALVDWAIKQGVDDWRA